MGRDAAHGVQRDRPADHFFMPAARPVGPGDVEHDLFFEGGVRQLGGDAPDRRGRHADFGRHRLGVVARVEIAFGEQLEDRHGGSAISQLDRADQGRRDVGGQRVGKRLLAAVPAQRVAVGVAREQAVVGRARILDDQPGRVGVARQEGEIDLVGEQQLADQCEDQQSVGARPHAEPFVGDRRIAGLDRVDADEFGAVALEHAEADLDRVRIVVFGAAEHHEIARQLPVGLAELPERAADRIEPAGRHVDRAEAAMRGVVGRAELGRPPAGQRLALVASGEEGELARVAVTDRAEPADRDVDRLVPLDLGELAGAARTDPLQGFGQPRRRGLGHDAGGALGAQDAAVDRVIPVALDVSNRAVPHVDLDAAAAGALITGREFDLVGDRRRGIDDWFGHAVP